jgi:putative hydrolase of the HAD superfamily
MGLPVVAASADPIEAVLFDYGLVLSAPPKPSAWARMMGITGFEEAQLHSGYWAHRHDYDRGALTGAGYWNAVASQAGGDIESGQLAELLQADVELWGQPNPPMVDWAGRLQRAGIRTGILSNIGDSIAKGLQAKLDWIGGFDHCTWSHELFMAKPEREIYLKTADAMKTAPAKILFIDDREDNIAAAKEVGMQAVRYTTHAEFEHEMRERGLGWLLDVGASASG